MKVKYLYLIFALIGSFTFQSCQKPIDDSNIKYIGSWGSDKYSMEIWKNGRGVIEKINQDPIECNVKIKDNQIIFSSGFKRKFDITQEPSTDGFGNTIMYLEGNRYLKH